MSGAVERRDDRLPQPVRSTLIEWSLVLLVCAGAAGLISHDHWLWRIDLVIYDLAMSVPQRDPVPEVLIIAIDDESLATLGRWPWPRQRHAELLDRLRLAGSGPVGLDLILHEPSADDDVLAAAIAAHGQVVLAMTHEVSDGRISGEAYPSPPLRAAARAIGHIHIDIDPDGIARNAYLWEGEQGWTPQFALALLGLADAQAAAQHRPPAAFFALPGVWQRSDWLRIPFLGPPGSVPQVSYAAVLRGEVSASQLAGRSILVGATALGLGDRVPVPTSGRSRSMPGVEIHATLYSALLRNEGIRSLPPLFGTSFSIGAVVLLMLVMLRQGSRASLLVTLGLIGLILALCFVVLWQWRVWVPPAGALAGLLAAYPLWSWRRLEAAQRYLDQELARLNAAGPGLFALASPADSTSTPATPNPDRLQSLIGRLQRATAEQEMLQTFFRNTLESLPTGSVVVRSNGDAAQTSRAKPSKVYANAHALLLLNARTAQQAVEVLQQQVWPADWPQCGKLPLPALDSAPLETQILGPADRPLQVLVSTLSMDQHPWLIFGLSDLSKIREAQRQRDHTLHFLSHDLRAPLSSIITLSENAGSEKLPEAQQRSLRYVQRALDLTDQLLRLARAEALDPSKLEEVDLVRIAEEAVDEAYDLARGAGVQLRIDHLERAEDEERLVHGDAELLRRALINLLTNAIKYSGRNASVLLHTRSAAGMHCVEVIDWGCGISREHLQLLFSHFGRLPTGANRKVNGIGLGLSMVATVARQHGGRVEVESQPGVGSSFRLLLPRAERTEAGTEATAPHH